MKKLILLALTAVMMAGCKVFTRKSYEVDYEKIVIIDSCEYIENGNIGGFISTHKGNCRFCKERREKEMKELVELLKEK